MTTGTVSLQRKHPVISGVGHERGQKSPSVLVGVPERRRKRPVVGCTVEETGGNPYGTNRIGSLRSPMTCGEGLHTGNFEQWDELP
jgi:hypothetical protein